MKIIAWCKNCALGIVKYDNDVVSLIEPDLEYLNKKAIKSLFNEEDVLNIKDIDLEYVNKEIETEEEYKEYMGIKLKEHYSLGEDEYDKNFNIMHKYFNENGVTEVLKTIINNLIFYCRRDNLFISWFNDCKKYMRITTEEQKNICAEIETLIKEVKMYSF